MNRLLNLLLVFFMPIISQADQFVYVSYEQALKAKNVLQKQSQVILHCTCCDSSKQYIMVDSVDIAGQSADYRLFISGITQYGLYKRIPIDLAYCYIKVKGKAVSMAKYIALTDSNSSPQCYKDFTWFFPESASDYWKSNLHSLSVSIMGQTIQASLDSLGLIQFTSQQSTQYIGNHLHSSHLSIDVETLEQIVSFIACDSTTCSAVIKLPYDDIKNNFLLTDLGSINVHVWKGEEVYDMISASLSFTNKDGGLDETSTLSPNFPNRVIERLYALPVREEWQKVSLFSELYPQGIIKINFAQFMPANKQAAIAAITLRNVCVIPD